MNVNDASRIVIDDFRVTLLIGASLTDNSRGAIYNHYMFVVQATGKLAKDKRSSRKALLKGKAQYC
jgi:hypothetical protein